MACTADTDRLLPDVLMHAPAAPEPMALRMICDAAREFCRRTRLWRDRDEFTLSSGDYERVCGCENADVIEIEWAELAGITLEPVTGEWLDEECPGWTEDTEIQQQAKWVTQLYPNTIRCVPRSAGLLKLRLVLEPSRAAPTLPSFLVDQHGALIGKGAAAMLLGLSGQPFSNPSKGLELRADFEAGLNRAHITASKGQQRAPLRTRGQYM